MKEHFGFKLDGGKIFPYYIAIWVALFAFVIAYFTIFAPNLFLGTGGELEVNYGFLTGYIVTVFLLAVVEMLCIFPIYGSFLNSFSYKNIQTKFDAKYSSYLLLICKGIFLSVITLGIYSFWFEKNLTKFFIDNTSYNNNRFKFKGKAIVLLLYVLLPLIAYLLFFSGYVYALYAKILIAAVVSLIFVIVSICTLIYLIYKWYINLEYNGLSIKFKRGIDVYGVLFITGQILLWMITLGLYAPAMQIRMYRYFVNRTIVTDKSGAEVGTLGCELRMGEDFWYLFGQMLLILVTLFIYAPWAYCFITERFASKTYILTKEE